MIAQRRIDFSIFVSKKSRGKYETHKMDLRGRLRFLLLATNVKRKLVTGHYWIHLPFMADFIPNAYCDCILSGSFDK